MLRSARHLFLCTALIVPAAMADQVTKFQVNSTDTANEAVTANVVLDINSSGVLTITLQNTIAGESSVGQAVSGLQFTLSTLSGTANLSSSSGDLVTVAANGGVTDHGSSTLTGWTAATNLKTITLTAVGGGQPKQTILGPATGNAYPSAGGSIAGNSTHNDFVSQTATFVLNGLTGVDLSTLVSAVKIGFGTAGTDYIDATQSITSTPEPGTFALVGLGALMFGAFRQKSKRSPTN